MTLRKRFRELIARPKLLVMPGAYDALSTRVVEAEGFEAVMAGGYAAIGSMLAEPDGGQSNVRDYADHYARICAAVDVPVFVDADTGFGGVNNVRQMVRAFEAAGVAGFFFSDQTFPNRCGYLPGKQVAPVAEMLARIKAALDARRDADLLIVARTDVFAIEGLDRAIERCQLYIEAGADTAKPQGVDEVSDIARVVREVPGAHFATLSQAAGRAHATFTELERIGVAVATLPSLTLFAAARAVRQVLRKVTRDNSLADTTSDVMTLAEYYDLVRLERQTAREKTYEEAASALVEPKRKSRKSKEGA